MKLSSDDLPMFFEDSHRAIAGRLKTCAPAIAAIEVGNDSSARDAAAVRALADAGLFALVVPPHTWPATGKLDARAVCLAREMLGYVSPRADSIFAVQGLGTHGLLIAGNAGQRAQRPAYGRGEKIAAFALTEPDAGSDVAAIATRATLNTNSQSFRLDGDKLFISNATIADHAIVFATEDPARGHQALTAFWVPLDAPGITIEPQIPTSPHPLGALRLRNVIVSVDDRIGTAGQGMQLALQTLDAFRVSVGAAAVGMARRALDETARFVARRMQFGKRLADHQLVQAHLADMAVDLDAARLLVLRAAYLKDTTTEAGTIEVSIAKLGATEAASRVIDRAVQLFGGRGVIEGAVVEQLYRAIRPLRIYEGTSEIQRTIIGRAIGKAGRA